MGIADIVLKEFDDLGIYDDYIKLDQKDIKKDRFFMSYVFDFFLWGVS